MDDIKRISINEFREIGLLAEVNRVFFHPIGLALEITVDQDGVDKLGGIWDYRDDPEGIIYGDPFPEEKITMAREFISKRHDIRRKTLGYVYQTLATGGDNTE